VPRTFDGANDSLHCAVGGLSAMTYGSFAAIIKRNGTTYHNIMTLHNSTGTSRGGLEIENNADGNHLTYQYDGGFVMSNTITVVNADGWVLVATAKSATGTAVVRCSKYVYSTGTWTHENSNGSALADFTSPGGSGTMRFGEWEGSDDFGGDIAVAACWSGRGLSDAEVENLAYSMQGWHASAPTAMWIFDQAATTQALDDLTGGGANQSALTGTTVSTNSLPGFTYGHPIMIPTTASVQVVTGEAALAGSGTLTADALLQVPGLAALAGEATLAAAPYETPTADLAADAAMASDSEVVARSIDWQWYGYEVFSTFEERDRAFERIRDFVEATRDTGAHPDEFYGTGLVSYDDGHIGDHDGPAISWSYRVSDPLIVEAQMLSGDIQDYALDGQSGTTQLED